MFLITAKSNTELEAVKKQTLENIKFWLDTNTMKINEDETNILKFGPSMTYEFAKCLGVHVDAKLDWQEHLLHKKLSSALRRIKSIADEDTALIAYHANFMSVTLTWGGFSEAFRAFFLVLGKGRSIATQDQTCFFHWWMIWMDESAASRCDRTPGSLVSHIFKVL